MCRKCRWIKGTVETVAADNYNKEAPYEFDFGGG